MSKPFTFVLAASLYLAAPAQAQEHVLGPRSISEDSIQVTITEIQLKVVGSEDRMGDGLTPALRPSGDKEAQIWFALGFMLDSCRVAKKQRVDSTQPSLGATLHNITFHCHYKASEFRSALSDMLK
jgi:hypothetical protein